MSDAETRIALLEEKYSNLLDRVIKHMEEEERERREDRDERARERKADREEKDRERKEDREFFKTFLGELKTNRDEMFSVVENREDRILAKIKEQYQTKIDAADDKNDVNKITFTIGGFSLAVSLALTLYRVFHG